jgi:hypothetical protein
MIPLFFVAIRFFNFLDAAQDSKGIREGKKYNILYL